MAKVLSVGEVKNEAKRILGTNYPKNEQTIEIPLLKDCTAIFKKESLTGSPTGKAFILPGEIRNASCLVEIEIGEGKTVTPPLTDFYFLSKEEKDCSCSKECEVCACQEKEKTDKDSEGEIDTSLISSDSGEKTASQTVSL